METHRSQQSLTIAVVGAGLAGVTAAVRLADAGHKVYLYEKSSFIGGRAGSVRDKTSGRELDLAQHVYLFCCTRYRALLSRLGTDRFAPLRSPLDVAVIDGRYYPARNAVARLRSFPLPTGLHMAPAFLRYRHLTLRERLHTARTLLKIAAADKSEPQYAATTFADWLRNQGESENALASFWDVIVVAALNACVEQVSAFWGLMLFQDALLKHRRGTEVGIPQVPLSQLLRPVAGILTERGGALQLGKAVQHVVTANNRVTGIKLSDGQLQPADRVILAVSHRDVAKLLPTPLRQSPFFAGIADLPTNPIVDLHLGFAEPAPACPFAFGVVLHSPVQWFFWHEGRKRLSLSISNPGELMDMSASQVEKVVVDAVRRLFNCPMPRWVVVRKNRHATFSAAPGTDRFRKPQRTPVQGLYLAGDWTLTGWPATMESAVRSGELAAEALLSD